jgi:nucleoside-diphosphate-sugar epimerase
MKKKILITGGAGYKGVLLTDALLKLNHDVTILDNFMYGYDSVLHLISNKNLTINKVDIRNLKQSDIDGFDVVFHLAGISGMPACATNPHSAESINVDAVTKLISFMKPEQLLINASTTSMYGYSDVICDEESIISPVSIYGKTKFISENLIQARDNSISLRFATVFGVSPKMRNDLMVNDFTYKAIIDRSIILFAGETKRTFIHINDAIRAYIFAMDNALIMKNNIYNVGDDSMNLSKIDISNNIKKYVKFEIIESGLPDLDKRNFEISFKKINALGFKTEYDLNDGILDLVKLYSFYVQYTPYKII